VQDRSNIYLEIRFFEKIGFLFSMRHLKNIIVKENIINCFGSHVVHFLGLVYLISIIIITKVSGMAILKKCYLELNQALLCVFA
jgi:hypothetical protein